MAKGSRGRDVERGCARRVAPPRERRGARGKSRAHSGGRGRAPRHRAGGARAGPGGGGRPPAAWPRLGGSGGLVKKGALTGGAEPAPAAIVTAALAPLMGEPRVS